MSAKFIEPYTIPANALVARQGGINWSWYHHYDPDTKRVVDSYRLHYDRDRAAMDGIKSDMLIDNRLSRNGTSPVYWQRLCTDLGVDVDVPEFIYVGVTKRDGEWQQTLIYN